MGIKDVLAVGFFGMATYTFIEMAKKQRNKKTLAMNLVVRYITPSSPQYVPNIKMDNSPQCINNMIRQISMSDLIYLTSNRSPGLPASWVGVDFCSDKLPQLVTTIE